MKNWHTYISMCLASNILFGVGCSLMIDQPKGEPHSLRALESQSKSLAGVYADHGSDGSIKPHTQIMGTAGRSDGQIIIGGMLDVLDIKTGTTKSKGTMGETTPKVRIGDRTFPAEAGPK